MAAIKSNTSNRKNGLFAHVKYEHMVAGVSGGVTSTLILHPLDLIKIRFAGNIVDADCVNRFDLVLLSFSFNLRTQIVCWNQVPTSRLSNSCCCSLSMYFVVLSQ